MFKYTIMPVKRVVSNRYAPFSYLFEISFSPVSLFITYFPNSERSLSVAMNGVELIAAIRYTCC
ncbi:hypothetical protein Pla110_31500 [Polystyrenella longa]|uniref:Uncharacterized protein n=1 Tax=Polystyrenella longa TaxID=2528007 RepID=A0A518CQA4_9PLAN|nr:hypothetical protein Pla110_31500 [Polystyrenella longa]